MLKPYDTCIRGGGEAGPVSIDEAHFSPGPNPETQNIKHKPQRVVELEEGEV